MATRLELAKAARNEAHAVYLHRLAQVQEDLAARSIGGRIADRAAEVAAEAAEVANDNKGVIAGTIAALALWFLRAPIIRLGGRLWNEYQERTDDD